MAENTITAAVLTSEGVLTKVELTNLLVDCYRLIDCTTVDLVRLAPDLGMWLDDMGMGGEVNPAATKVAAAHGYGFQPYFRTAVFTSSGVDSEGNTVGLTDAAFARIARILAAQ